MRMKKEIPTEILQTINALNTMNGGVSEPTLILKQLEDHRAVLLRVPGIDLDKIQVEVRNNVLSIFHFFVSNTGDQTVQTPRLLYNKQIPYFIDQENIAAHVEENFLKVVLPFNKLAEGYSRRIEHN
jgi:HSP20 family molecular chaperone IbpA